MNTSTIKAYAPEARKEFIRAVGTRAHVLGLSENDIVPMEVKGDFAFIGGQAFPASIAPARRQLERAILAKGFEQVVEEAAFTWFNRLIALRYMELHDYLPCACMILGSDNATSHSSSSGSSSSALRPAILDRLSSLDAEMLPQADLARAVELRLEGGKEEELYRLLLVGQCNSLSSAMPLLFERVSDASELLLPDNLLHSDSVIQHLVQGIPAEEWDSVEIVGWLYQFYISEKKSQVIGKVVKSEDIPAATQLFTPNWIVQYMVHNTLGRQWLASNPQSGLRQAMPYYIEPAEQDAEVQAEFTATTPAQLAPESITFFDPACGSGHILVEAYNLFKRIYQEKGYSPRAIPRLILEKNLYGVDIDERAAQLTQFALMMMARNDDRRILDNPPAMNIMALQEWLDTENDDASTAMQARASAQSGQTLLLSPSTRAERAANLLLHTPQHQGGNHKNEQGLLVPVRVEQANLPMQTANAVQKSELLALCELFSHAKTFGSLIRIPLALKNALPRLRELLSTATTRSENEKALAEELFPLLRQAELLSMEYDCVVANPPYMGSKGLNATLKAFLKNNYENVKSDLFSAFIVRDFELCKQHGQLGFMSPFVWMFISSYEKLRSFILQGKCITSLVQLEYSGFDGATVPICTYTFQNSHRPKYQGSYVRLSDFKGSDIQAPKTLEAIQNPACGWFFTASAADFEKIPGSPIAYWVSNRVREIFAENSALGDIAEAAVGLQTSDNNRFLRQWFEVKYEKIGFSMSSCQDALESEQKWFPYNKGGDFRKWYGNQDFIVNWENDGEEIKSFTDEKGKVRSRPQNTNFYFKESVSWSKVSSSNLALRKYQEGFIFADAGMSIFQKKYEIEKLLCFINSIVCRKYLEALSPTLNFEVGHISLLPIKLFKQFLNDKPLISLARTDWDNYETSWDFKSLPLLRAEHCGASLAEAYTSARTEWQGMTNEMKALEEENNRIFIDAYGLQKELTPDVPLKEITLTCNPYYRYGIDADSVDDAGRSALETRLYADSIKELLSYAIGCMLGRYSLDEEGLCYAAADNDGFDPSRYCKFPADDDGIVPVADIDSLDLAFADDATIRISEFVDAVWGHEHNEENLQSIANALDAKQGESAKESICRYLSTKFFKDQHCKTYKKRPIYWLFSSGKHKAFECLVYLHRYNENTLPRMRSLYVTPLQGKIAQRIDYLDRELASTTSTATKNALTKQRKIMLNKQTELRQFDDQLRHYADMRIHLDLDDGVKTNYAKFDTLLAEQKLISGGKDE